MEIKYQTSTLYQRVSQEIQPDEEEDECSICLDPMVTEIFITNCNHSFHESCIKKWTKKTCPLCRGELENTEQVWGIFHSLFAGCVPPVISSFFSGRAH